MSFGSILALLLTWYLPIGKLEKPLCTGPEERMVFDIVKTHFDANGTLGISWAYLEEKDIFVQDCVFIDMNSSNNFGPVIIYGSGFNGLESDVTDNIISGYIFRGSLGDLHNRIFQLSSSAFWNPSAKFVLSLVNESSPRLLELFNFLWKYQIVNVVVASAEHDEEFNIYTYFPYKSQGCGNRIDEVVLLDSWLQGTFIRGADLFPDKSSNNLMGCELLTGTVYYPPFCMPLEKEPGLEMLLLRALEIQINTTLIIQPPDDLKPWGRLSMGTWSGVLGDLERHLIDIAVGGHLPSSDRLKYFSSTAVYFTDVIKWHVPNEKPLTVEIMVKGFDVSLMLSIAASLTALFFLLVLATYYHSLRFSVKFNCKEVVAYTLLGFWGILTEVATNLKLRSGAERIAWASFGLLMLNLNVVLKSVATSTFFLPTYGPRIDTMQQLLNSTLVMQVDSPLLREIYQDEPQVFDRISVCSSISNCRDRLSRDEGDFAFAASGEFIRQNSMVYFFGSDGKSFIHQLQNDVHLHNYVIYLRKGSPLLENINNLIRRSQQAGLIEFWASQSRLKPNCLDNFSGVPTAENKRSSKVCSCHPKSYSALTMTYVFPLLVMLAIGLSLSCLIFVAEAIAGRSNASTK